MKISVVTVCFNSSATIRHTLESFVAQDHPDKELVVIDGGSTDGTIELVRQAPQDQVRLFSERDSGIYDAMNKGLARFSGEAVGFLNSDDRFHDRRVLSDVAAALASADVVFGDVDFVSDHANPKLMRRWRSTPYHPGAFRRGWMAPHPTLYVRRAVAAAVGQFNLKYRISSDYDWMLRALEVHRFRSSPIGRTFVDMKVGGNSTSGWKAYVRGNLEALDSRRRWLAAPFVDLALVAKPLGKISQFVVGPTQPARTQSS